MAVGDLRLVNRLIQRIRKPSVTLISSVTNNPLPAPIHQFSHEYFPKKRTGNYLVSTPGTSRSSTRIS